MERIPRAIYTKELREEAVKLVTEGGLSIPEVWRRLSVAASTIRYWVKANREGKLKDVGRQQRPLTEIEMELARVKHELAEARMERDILKKATAYFAKESPRYAMMKGMRFRYGIGVMSRILGVSKSGYYKWLNRKPSKRVQEEGRLEVEIKAAHQRTRETCGAERLQQELKEQGVEVGIGRIRRIRKKLGIRCKQRRKFRATTDSRHAFPVAENLLNQEFEAKGPNEIWVSDITYIPTEEGWLYVAGHKDLFTGEIVGYAMGSRITKNLVSQSLFKAVAAKRPGAGLIHHSDRGRQYCAYEYRKLMDQFKMRLSMSRKGDCYDNAPMESFWGTLKNELIHHRHYKTREQAIREITEYIEVFYNRQRRQARLGYLSPAVYERQFYARQAAA